MYFSFQRPKVEQIRAAMMSVCFKEKIKIKPEALTELIIGYAFEHCVGLINRLFICCLIDFLFSNLDHFKVTLEIVFERFWQSCGSK